MAISSIRACERRASASSTALRLLFRGEFQTLQFLIGARQLKLALCPLPLDILEAGAEVLTPALDRAQKRWKRQPSNIGVVGTLALAGDALLQIGELALKIGAHAVKRTHPPLQVFHFEALQTHQRVSPLHDALSFPAPAIASSATYPSARCARSSFFCARNASNCG